LRVAPDDDVYRVNAVWLGPRGLTFPWTARYLAYATWLVTFLVILLFEAVVPALHTGVPPVWEISITTLFTYAVMSFVDHERPVRAVWRTFLADLRAPRATGKSRPTRVLTKVRVHARPRHDRRLTRAYFAGTTHTVPTHAARYAGTDPADRQPQLRTPKSARLRRRHGRRSPQPTHQPGTKAAPSAHDPVPPAAPPQTRTATRTATPASRPVRRPVQPSRSSRQALR
jgi:hypothetical protein